MRSQARTKTLIHEWQEQHLNRSPEEGWTSKQDSAGSYVLDFISGVCT